MLIPLIVLGIVAAVYTNRRRIATRVEREYVSRYRIRADGVAEGGESFAAEGTNGCGVLLLHGSGDTPQTLRYLAGRLNDAGYGVEAPLLPGHGRSPRDFASASADEYLAAAQDALNAVRRGNDRVALVGLSMGGAVATQLAAKNTGIRALVLLAPYLVPPPTVTRIARMSALWGLFTPYLEGRGEDSVFDAAASVESRAYGTFSPGALRALVQTAARGLTGAANLDMPVMVVNSERDNRIPRGCAEEALRAFRTTPETHWVSGCGHVITIDYCKDDVANLVLRFLDAHAS